MGQAYALSTLHVCRKPAETAPDGRVIKAPQIEVVPAGTIADVSDEDFKAFEAAGAVRRPSKMDKAAAEGGADEPAIMSRMAGPDKK